MKTIAAITLLILSASSALAGGVFQYVEQGDGRIYLAPRCLADSVNECNCAIAGPGAVPSFEDAFMCWTTEGGRIIFTSDKYRFEKGLEELKTEIEDPTNPPPSTPPRRENPTPDDRPSGVPS
jgi:hypothetical protein